MHNLIHRILIVALPGAALLVVNGPACALGLGEARVDSYLGQPLQVTVRLLEASAEELETLTIAPAAPADYERVGLPGDGLAFGLEVSVDRSVVPPVARITSRSAVTDPVVRILLDARWSGGRLLREYTLFLDPPAYEAAPPPPAAAARPGTAEDPAVRVESRSAPGEPYGPVKSGETLWSIASAYRPDTSLTMNQVMLAILYRNPHAFAGSNVNRLFQGVELDMPGLDEIMAIDPVEAMELVAAQNRAWRDLRGPVDVPRVADAAVPEATVPPETGAGAGSSQAPEIVHRLELVPPEAETSGRGGPGLADEDPAGFFDTLARTEEELLAAQLEAEVLRRRMESPGAADIDPASGMSVADADLAALEWVLREARLAETQQPPGEDLSPVELLGEEITAYFETLDTPGTDDADARAKEAAGTLAAPVDERGPAVAASAAGRTGAAGTLRQSLTEWAREPASWGLFLGLLMLLFVLAWLIYRYRTDVRPDAEQVESGYASVLPPYRAGGDSSEAQTAAVDPATAVEPEGEEDAPGGIPQEDGDTPPVGMSFEGFPEEPGDETEIDDIFSLGEDDAEVKLDLARAYVSMNDTEAARAILNEVLDEGNANQRRQARELLESL